MNSFTFEIYDKENTQPSIVDVTNSGGAYAVNIDEVYRGAMVEDNAAPLGYSTTDKNLLPYLESIVIALNNRRDRISIRELLSAIVGIVQLIAFLFGTVITFRLKQLMHKVKMCLLLNFLPAIFDFIGFGQGSVTGL